MVNGINPDFVSIEPSWALESVSSSMMATNPFIPQVRVIT